MAVSIRKSIRLRRLDHLRDNSFRCNSPRCSSLQCNNHRFANLPGLKSATPSSEPLSCLGCKPRINLKVLHRAVALQALSFQPLSFLDHSLVAPYFRDRTLLVPKLLGHKSIVPNLQAQQLPALSLRGLSSLETSSLLCSVG